MIDSDTHNDDEGRPTIRKGVAKDRIVSHSDPEMRHGRKSASRRFDGHKIDVVTDEKSELVLGVDIRAGNASDGEGAAPLLNKVQGVEGIEVETLLGDMAYSDGDTRVAVEDAGATLVAKVPPVSNKALFPKTDFVIDAQAATVTCPAGVTAADARSHTDHKGRPGLRFVFPAEVCAACALRASCTTMAARWLWASTRPASLLPEPPRRTRRSRPSCAGAPRWSERSTTSRTSACASPATGAGARPGSRRSLLPPLPTFSGWPSSMPSPRPRSWPVQPDPGLNARRRCRGRACDGLGALQALILSPLNSYPTPSACPAAAWSSNVKRDKTDTQRTGHRIVRYSMSRQPDSESSSLPAYLRVHPDGLWLAVKVQPRASVNEIGEPLGNELRVRVTAPPVDSAANEAVLRPLAERLDCARNQVELVRGHTSRHKVVKLRGLSTGIVLARLRPTDS